MVDERKRYPEKDISLDHFHNCCSLFKGTYTIMNDTFKSMLQFLLQSVGLQNVDNANEKEQTFALIVTCWNASGTTINK